MIREFEAESSSRQTASSAKESSRLRILRRTARKSRVCAASPQSKGTGESPIAVKISDSAGFLSARRRAGALSVCGAFRPSPYGALCKGSLRPAGSQTHRCASAHRWLCAATFHRENDGTVLYSYRARYWPASGRARTGGSSAPTRSGAALRHQSRSSRGKVPVT